MLQLPTGWGMWIAASNYINNRNHLHINLTWGRFTSIEYVTANDVAAICHNDNDNESNFIAMNYINHNTRDIQARLIDGK